MQRVLYSSVSITRQHKEAIQPRGNNINKLWWMPKISQLWLLMRCQCQIVFSTSLHLFSSQRCTYISKAVAFYLAKNTLYVLHKSSFLSGITWAITCQGENREGSDNCWILYWCTFAHPAASSCRSGLFNVAVIGVCVLWLCVSMEYHVKPPVCILLLPAGPHHESFPLLTVYLHHDVYFPNIQGNTVRQMFLITTSKC